MKYSYWFRQTMNINLKNPVFVAKTKFVSKLNRYRTHSKISRVQTAALRVIQTTRRRY